MEIKVLAISGSPRKGNSEFLARKALEEAKNFKEIPVKTELYSFRGKEFKPCLGCGYCFKNKGDCVHQDDFAPLKEKWLASDVILYSVPVYHMSMPGQVKCFIDRLGNSFFPTFQPFFEEGPETIPKLLKIVGSIAQGLHIFSGQEHTITDLINHALIMQSIPVVGDLWESYIGVGGWTNNVDSRNALEEEYEKGDFDADIAVRATERLTQRALEMAVIVKTGVGGQKKMFGKQPHYLPILQQLKEQGI